MQLKGCELLLLVCKLQTNKVVFTAGTWRVHIADKQPGLGAFSHEDTGPVAYNYHLL